VEVAHKRQPKYISYLELDN